MSRLKSGLAAAIIATVATCAGEAASAKTTATPRPDALTADSARTLAVDEIARRALGQVAADVVEVDDPADLPGTVTLYGRPRRGSYFGVCRGLVTRIKFQTAPPQDESARPGERQTSGIDKVAASDRYYVVGPLGGGDWTNAYEAKLERDCSALKTTRAFFEADDEATAVRAARSLVAVSAAARDAGRIPFLMDCPVSDRQACADWRELAAIGPDALVSASDQPCERKSELGGWQCYRQALSIRDPTTPINEYGGAMWTLEIEIETVAFTEMDGVATREIEGFVVKSVAPKRVRWDH